MASITRIYVASSWRNAYQPAIVEELRASGFDAYDFRHPSTDDDGFHWSEVDEAWESWEPDEYRDALKTRIAVEGFKNDWDAMREADACVLVLPSGRSAHLEAGYFVGAGKPLYIYMPEKQEPELMYKMATHICLSRGELLARLVYG